MYVVLSHLTNALSVTCSCVVGHGHCEQPNECICDASWEGRACEFRVDYLDSLQVAVRNPPLTVNSTNRESLLSHVSAVQPTLDPVYLSWLPASESNSSVFKFAVKNGSHYIERQELKALIPSFRSATRYDITYHAANIFIFQMNEPVIVVLLTMCALLLVALVIAVVLIQIHRSHPVLKAASFRMLYVVCVGLGLCYASVIEAIQQWSAASCFLFMWTLPLGILLTMRWGVHERRELRAVKYSAGANVSHRCDIQPGKISSASRPDPLSGHCSDCVTTDGTAHAFGKTETQCRSSCCCCPFSILLCQRWQKGLPTGGGFVRVQRPPGPSCTSSYCCTSQ